VLIVVSGESFWFVQWLVKFIAHRIARRGVNDDALLGLSFVLIPDHGRGHGMSYVHVGRRVKEGHIVPGMLV
jgi:hypothetical protein